MTNEIRKIQLKQKKSLLKIYKKRLEEIKKSILELANSGGNTLKLAIEKKKLEKLIKKLEQEFKEFSDEAIEESYRQGAQDQKKRISALGIAVIALASVQIASIENIYYSHLLRITKEIAAKVKSYVRTDFSDKHKVVQALNNLSQTGILSSEVDTERWQSLMKRLEQNFKNKDIFTIPYFDKNGNVVRRVKASTYAEMLARTLCAQTFRKAAKDSILEQFENEGDLVEILGESVYPDSPCIPYQGKVLSLTGRTKGYTTVKEAETNGLFHPNCIHSFAVTEKVIDAYSQKDISLKA